MDNSAISSNQTVQSVVSAFRYRPNTQLHNNVCIDLFS